MTAVMVTGAAGVVGRAVCRQLVDNGIRVIGHDLRPLPGDVARHTDGIEWVGGDLLDWPHLRQVIGRVQCDFVVHLAALVASRANAQPREAVHVNVAGVANICEAARLHGYQGVVYLSSRSVYGNVEARYAHPHYERVPEEHPCRPDAFYPTTKRAAELVIDRYAALYQLPAVMLRIGAIYGPGKSASHGVTRVFSEAIESAVRGMPYDIGGAEQQEDFVYSEDIPKAILAAVEYLCRETASNSAQIFNIGSGIGVSIAEFAELVHHKCGRGPTLLPGVGVMGRDSRQSFVMCDERARQILGYRPGFDLESGIEHYISSLRKSAR